jgi:DNA repair protein RadC
MRTNYEIANEAVALYGSGRCGLDELISMIIGPTNIHRSEVEKITKNDFNYLAALSVEELRISFGLPELAARRLSVCFSIARHYKNKPSKSEMTEIRNSDDLFERVKYIQSEEQEVVVVVLLDSKNKIIRVDEVHRGGIHSSVFDNKVILQKAIRYGAASLAIAHNHPSGNPLPSYNDKEATVRLIAACEIVGVRMMDHIVIGDKCYYSFIESGELE